MRRVATWIVLALGLIPLWRVTVLFLGSRGPGLLILITFIYGLGITALALAARRIGPRGWLLAGLLTLAGLFVPTAELTDNLGSPATFYEAIFQIVVFLLPSLALIMAAVLLYSGFNLLVVDVDLVEAASPGSQATKKNKGKLASANRLMRWLVAGLLILAGILAPIMVRPGKFGSLSGLFGSLFPFSVLGLSLIALIMAAVLLYADNNLTAEAKHPAAAGDTGLPTTPRKQGKLASACFVLSGLLLLKTLHNLYWLTVWDNTTDSLGYIWIILPVLAAFFSGFLLVINLRRWTVWAGLGYLLLVPGLTIAVSYIAQEVDYRQLTEAHAGQVSQRVEAYYAREGRYPQELDQVKPWYVTSLPGPFIIYGQDWCYEAGDDFYHLGYVYREHWSSPELIGRVYRIGGQAPENIKICAKEIDALVRQEPIFYEK